MPVLLKAVEALGGAVLDVVESVGDAISDVVDWAVDEIVQPVFKVVTDVIDSVLDDPIKAIAQVAAIATGNAWALPLIEGADVAIAGGDLGDVVKAVAISYVAQNVGTTVGKAAGQYAGEVAKNAGAEIATQKIAERVVGSAAASASVAVVTGQDPLKALVTGGVRAAVPALLGKVPGFTGLPPTAQQVVAQAVTTQLSGGNVTTAVIGSLIQSSGIVTDVLKSFDPDGTKMSNAQRAIATDILMGTATAALTGGNVPAAMRAAIMKNGSKALGDILSSGFKTSVDSVATKYTTADKAAEAVDANIAQQEKVARDYNTVVTDLNNRVAEQDRLKAAYDNAAAAQKANPNQATTDAANAAARTYNDFATRLNADYTNTIQPKINQYAAELAQIQETYGNLEQVYANAIKDVGTAAESVKKELKPAIDASNKAFIEVMDPTFKPDEYRKLNGLGADVDVYEHWLGKGQFDGLKTNNVAAQADFTAEKVRLVQELAAEKGISLAQISDTDIKNFFVNVDSKYGGNLSALKGASIQDFITGNTKSYDDLLKQSKTDGFRIEVAGRSYGAWDKPAGYTPPSGMRLATIEEFDNDTARLEYTNDGKSVWVAADSATAPKMWDPSLGDYVPIPQEIIIKGTKLSDLKATDPEAWLVTAGSIPGDNLGGIDDFLYNFAKATMDLAKVSGNSTIINTAGNALKAGGGILESFNGLVVLAGKNPKNTDVGKFAEKLVNLGKATTTAEYQAAVKDMSAMMGSGNGIIGTAKAIWGAAYKYPVEFLAEIVGVEGMQEAVPLLIGGGAKTAAQGLVLARGMGAKLAAQWGTRAGLTAAAISDITESVGGSAQGAFTEAYKVAKAKGMSDEEATMTALEIGARTGLVSGVITATTLGIGGMALEKALLGKAGNGDLAGIIDTLGRRVKEGGTITIREGVVEGIEEGTTQAVLEGQLYKLDPTRDVSGNIASSSILGAVAGGGVSGGMYAGAKTGDVISNLLISSNPAVATAINNAPNAAAAATALSNLGITDAKVQTNLLNTKYDAAYTSTAEAREALRTRQDFVASDADINALVGDTKNTDLAAAVEKYVDPRVFDIDEVKAAAAAEGYTISDADAAKLVGQKDEAAATAAARAQFDPLATTVSEAKQMMRDLGYTNMTDAEALSLAGQIKEVDAKKNIEAYVAPRMVTFDDAKKFLADEGYTDATDEEIRQFVGQQNDANFRTAQQQAATEFADTRVVTEDEVRAAYEALGLKKPTQVDVQKLVGQYAQTDLAGRAEENLDPARYNSIMEQLDSLTAGASQEMLAAVALVKDDLNKQITALGGDLTKLSSDVANTKEVLTKAVADAQKGNTESFDAVNKAITDLKAAGLTPEQVQKIVDDSSVGVSKEFKAALDAAAKGNTEALDNAKTTLEEKIGSVQTALETALGDQKTAFDAKVKDLMDQGDTYQKATETALADIGVQVTDLGADFTAKLKDTSDALETSLGTKISDVETNLLTKIADNEAAGLTRDEATQKAVSDLATELGTTKEDILTQIGATETTLNERVDTLETSLGTKISDVETNILDRVAGYERAGIGRDEALGRAVDDVATELGTTREDILTQIGETEAALTTKLGEAEQRLDTRIGDVQTTVGRAGVNPTQSDLDAIIQNLESQGAYDPQYDYNGDNVIDQKDRVAIEQYLLSQQTGYVPAIDLPFTFAPAPGSKFAPTGVFKTVADEAEATRRASAVQAERTRQANAAAALRTQRMGNLNTLTSMLTQAPDLQGQQVTVKAADPAKIGYIYDFNSIFANPAQEKMFASPYGGFAQGGAVRSDVDDVNDELLKFLKG